VNVTEQKAGLLPGEDLVHQGLEDLHAGRVTEHALLVLIASPRLQRLGLHIPTTPVTEPYEHQLYDLLAKRFGNAAHSQYNSLIRRITSYAHALARQNASANSQT
jgi:hypothetical protein